MKLILYGRQKLQQQQAKQKKIKIWNNLKMDKSPQEHIVIDVMKMVYWTIQTLEFLTTTNALWNKYKYTMEWRICKKMKQLIVRKKKLEMDKWMNVFW